MPWFTAQIAGECTDRLTERTTGCDVWEELREKYAFVLGLVCGAAKHAPTLLSTKAPTGQDTIGHGNRRGVATRSERQSVTASPILLLSEATFVIFWQTTPARGYRPTQRPFYIFLVRVHHAWPWAYCIPVASVPLWLYGRSFAPSWLGEDRSKPLAWSNRTTSTRHVGRSSTCKRNGHTWCATSVRVLVECVCSLGLVHTSVSYIHRRDGKSVFTLTASDVCM